MAPNAGRSGDESRVAAGGARRVAGRGRFIPAHRAARVEPSWLCDMSDPRHG